MKTATDAAAGIAVALAVVLAIPAHAHAQSAEAETLFREGKRLLKKGQIAEACEKLDASDRLEPTDGTELNLADCREKNGQLATAWATFVKAAASAKRTGNTKREAEARRRAAALESQLVYLTVVVPPDNRVDGLVIKRNDSDVDPALWGQRVPVDPADYTISAAAPGYAPWTTSVTVKTKNKKIEVPALEKRPERDRHGEPGRVAASDGSAASLSAESPPPKASGSRLPLILAAVGVVAAGTATIFGLKANSTESDANQHCAGTVCPDPTGLSLNKTARHDALVANIGFAVGGAAVVTAAVLWFTGSRTSHETASIVPIFEGGELGVGFARSF